MRVLVIAAIAAIVGGGAVYGALLYLGQNPVQVSVQLREETPPPAPALPPSPTALPPPTATASTTAAPPTVSPTATPRPTPTVTSAPIPTPTTAGPTEREIVVEAFAACDGKYSGEEKRHRYTATNSAIDNKLHSIASVRELVEENCGGVFPKFATALLATSTPSAVLTAPIPTSLSTPTRSPTPRPTPTPAPTMLPSASTQPLDGPTFEKAVHQLINSERVKRGLPALDWDERIAAIARDHSEDMASNDYFSHHNLEGQSPTDRGNRAGYPCRKALGGGVYSYGLGENIWRGWEYSSRIHSTGGTRYNWMSQTQIALQAVSSWMGSSGHRQNILDSQYDRTGVGVGFGSADGKPYAVYLTQNFC